MSLDVSGLPDGVRQQIDGFDTEITEILQRARDQVHSGLASAKLTLWFGGADAQTRNEIRDKLAKLRSFVLHHTVRCAYRLDRPAGENALAEGVKGGLLGKNVIALNSAQRVLGSEKDWGAIGTLNLSPNFANLPNYANGAVSAFGGQDRFETVVHELSHIVLGTGDDAYGGTAARALATTDAAKARNNAENWGLFVEDFRVAPVAAAGPH